MRKQFIHLCAICGKDYENNIRKSYKCPECEKRIAILKKIEMLDKAERKLTNTPNNYKNKQKIDISKEVQIVRERILKNIDKFSSIQEVMVAIQLEKQKIKYISQKEINGRKVDFFLPEMKIIIEIDGMLYHSDEEKELLRDKQIMQGIGNDYEIIHVESELVPKYTWNLKESLKFILEERKENKNIRSSTWDTYLFEQFRNMELFLKWRQFYDNKGIFNTNKQIRPNDKK